MRVRVRTPTIKSSKKKKIVMMAANSDARRDVFIAERKKGVEGRVDACTFKSE